MQRVGSSIVNKTIKSMDFPRDPALGQINDQVTVFLVTTDWTVEPAPSPLRPADAVLPSG
jgi:hypothetical protein